ncbi:MAG: hypothetical protein HYT31_02300 [Parcubacteria group bacterium]|nr:hypothetical protein [Parcubacteria group bacterium]
MPPAKSTDIDLLPKDLAAKKRPVPAPSAGPLVEYTDAFTGKKPDVPKPKKPSFFSRVLSVFGRRKKTAEPALAFKSSQGPLSQKKGSAIALPAERAADLPEGAPLPSALFAGSEKRSSAVAAGKPKTAPVREPFSPGVAAGDVSAMHVPSVSSGPLAPPRAVLQAAAPVLPKQAVAAVAAPKPAVQSKARLPARAVKPAALPVEPGVTGETEAPVHRLSHFDVNLLAAEYTETFKKSNPFAFLGAGAGIFALAVALAYGVLQMYHMRAQTALAQEERVVAALSETIATYEDASGQDSALREKAEASRELIGNHVSWHSFLGEVEAVTIPEITYVTFVASTKGTMLVSAFARDYTALARQIVVFQETPWIRDITITQATRVEESATTPAGVSFDMSLEIDEGVLYESRR